MYRKMPDTIEQSIAELWYTLIGTDGQGVIDRLNDLETHVKNMDNRLDVYFSGARKESCYYVIDKKEKTALKVEKTRSNKELVKFALTEGIKIGIAMGVFSAIGRLVGLL